MNRKLNWNEEFYLRAQKGKRIISSRIGDGYVTFFEAEAEKKRLESFGYSVQILVRTWN